MPEKRSSFVANSFRLLKQTFSEWLEDQAPQLGAALAYYTVFSLAPLILLLLAIVGFLFRKDPAGAWRKMTEQMSYFLDKSAIDVVANIAQTASHPNKGTMATIIGILLALLGASGVFGQLQNLLKGFSHYIQAMFPGGIVIALVVYSIFDLAVVVLLFALIFKFLPDVKIQWRDVWIGALMTAILFAIGKWALGFYLGSGAAASAYGAASSLITLLLWIYYSSQILLFGAEFTQVYAVRAGRALVPAKYAVPA